MAEGPGQPPEATKSVTKIVEDFKQFLRNAHKNPYVGTEHMFERFEISEKIKVTLQDKVKAKSNTELGNLLQHLIYKYLKENQEFQLKEVLDEDKFYHPTFGEAVWTMTKPMVTATTHTKLLEAVLTSYQAKGRADFYTCDSEGQSTLIDIKYTNEDHQHPSPGLALQLLLYQWMAGEKFKEKKGARMYLIRFVESTTEMQLIPFDPPEDIQYSKGRADVTSYEDIVRLFKETYYSKLLEAEAEVK